MQNNGEISGIVEELKRMLIEDLQMDISPDSISDHYSLLEGGLALDSIVLAELMARIEDRFRIQFDYRELRADLFDDLSRLAAFVVSTRAASQPIVGQKG